MTAAATGWWRLDLPISHTKASDWDYQLTLLRAVGEGWRAGGLPQWNPWTAGGSPLLGNPEAPVFSPMGLAAAVAHPAAVQRVALLAHMALLGTGTALLARRWGAPRWALAVAPLALLATDGIVWRVAHGHTMMVMAAWIPWALWAIRGPRAGRSGALAGLCVAAAAHGGGHTPAWLAAATLALATGAEALARRRLAPLGRLAIAGLVAALVAAPRLVAVVVEGADSARLRGPHAPQAMGDFGLGEALGWVVLDAPWWPLGGAPGLHEGLPSWHSPWWLALALVGAAAGAGVAGAPARRAGAATALVAALASLGHNLPVNVFGLLHAVPPLDRFRNPERWALVWLPLLSALAAVGAGQLARWAGAGRPWQARGAAAALGAASLGVAGLSLGPATARTRIDQITPDAVQRAPLAAPTAVAEPWRTNLECIGRNERCLDCSDAMLVEAPPGLALGPWAVVPPVTGVDWAPGAVAFTAQTDGWHQVPEAWAAGWQATATPKSGPARPAPTRAQDGLLAVEARAGDRVALVYESPGGGVARLLALAGLVLAGLLVGPGAGRRGAHRDGAARAPVAPPG